MQTQKWMYVCTHSCQVAGGNLSTQMTDYIEVSEDLNYVEGKIQRSSVKEEFCV